MAQNTVDHLLAHHLDLNERVPAALPHVLSLLQSTRALYTLELEEGQHGPLMHRYVLFLLTEDDRVPSLCRRLLLLPFR
jgi:hypothetical protein